MSNITKGKFLVKRKEGNFNIAFSRVHGTLHELQSRFLNHLHVLENHQFNNYKFDRRKLSFLQGRLAAKHALSVLLPEQAFVDFYIKSGVFHFPVVKGVKDQNIQVSISHTDKNGVALAFDEEHPMAIDIEEIDIEKISHVKEYITEAENGLFTLADAQAFTLLWTIKESLSKVLRTGLTLDLKLLEVKKVEAKNGLYISYFKNFTQYKAVSKVYAERVCTVVMPKNSEPVFGNFWDVLTV